MIEERKVKALIEEYLEGTDRFLVDVVIKPGNRILVFIDADSAVLIEHCIGLSRHIEKNLDREVEDFELNVSSSGLDQPYRLVRQYIKNVGREVSVVCEDGRKINGKLVAADQKGIDLIELIKEKKVITEVKHHLVYSEIKETKEIIKF